MSIMADSRQRAPFSHVSSSADLFRDHLSASSSSHHRLESTNGAQSKGKAFWGMTREGSSNGSAGGNSPQLHPNHAADMASPGGIHASVSGGNAGSMANANMNAKTNGQSSKSSIDRGPDLYRPHYDSPPPQSLPSLNGHAHAHAYPISTSIHTGYESTGMSTSARSPMDATYNNIDLTAGPRRKSIPYTNGTTNITDDFVTLPGGRISSQRSRQGSAEAFTTTASTTLQKVLAIPKPTVSTARFVFLCTLWYSCSALSSNTGKVIMTNFRFPVTLTIVQFFFVAAYCWVVTDGLRVLRINALIRTIVVRSGFASPSKFMHQRRQSSLHQLGSNTGGPPSTLSRLRRPTKQILNNTWPMAVFQVGGHIFSSMAISRVPVSTVHTIKALSPLFTVLAYAFIFNVSYSPATYLSLLPLTVGVMLACSSDLSLSNALGLICAFGSTLVFVSSNIVFKKLMPSTTGTAGGTASSSANHAGHASNKLDKINLLFFSSGMAFVLMVPLWVYSDMSAVLRLWLEPEIASPKYVRGGANVMYYFWLNGTVHFAQNYLAFAILSTTSPVTYSIASLVKRIAVICLAIIWFKQTVHPVQALGIGLTGLGLWMYNNAKRDVEKGEKKMRRLEAVKEGILPMSRVDIDTSRPNTPVPEYQALLEITENGVAPRVNYAHDFSPPFQSHTSAFRPNAYMSNGTQPSFGYPSSSVTLPSPPPSNTSPVQEHLAPLPRPIPLRPDHGYQPTAATTTTGNARRRLSINERPSSAALGAGNTGTASPPRKSLSDLDASVSTASTQQQQHSGIQAAFVPQEVKVL